MNYPVGDHMKHNMSIIKSMAKQLKVLYPLDNLILYCTGSSGAIIAGILSLLLPGREIRIAHVKKDGEDSHGVGRMFKADHYTSVIVDDFMASGASINRIYTAYKRMNDEPIDCLCLSGEVKLDHLDFIPITIIGQHLRGTETGCLDYSSCDEEATI